MRSTFFILALTVMAAMAASPARGQWVPKKPGVTVRDNRPLPDLRIGDVSVFGRNVKVSILNAGGEKNNQTTKLGVYLNRRYGNGGISQVEAVYREVPAIPSGQFRIVWAYLAKEPMRGDEVQAFCDVFQVLPEVNESNYSTPVKIQ